MKKYGGELHSNRPSPMPNVSTLCPNDPKTVMLGLDPSIHVFGHPRPRLYIAEIFNFVLDGDAPCRQGAARKNNANPRA